MARSRSNLAPAQLTLDSTRTSLVKFAVASLPSPHTRRAYAKAYELLMLFAEGRPVTQQLIHEWRTDMSGRLAVGTVNFRIAAIRHLVRCARDKSMLDQAQAHELLQVRSLPFRGTRMGNWLTEAQTEKLLSVPNTSELRGLRNYLILAILAGCALRRDELANLEIAALQQRDGRWVIADLPGKGGRVRTVAIPDWVRQAINSWLRATKIREGKLVRQLTLDPAGLSSQAIWDIVHKTARKAGIPHFGPHDLRRTCARLMREAGEDLEQIQAMLGHASLLTTQRYLGTVQNLRRAPNDAILFGRKKAAPAHG